LKLEDVGVIVTSCNDASTVSRCLDSVSGFGATVVVDAFSTDGTCQIAREFGAAVYVRPSHPEGDQKNWALTRIDTDWVLSLEATEAVDDDLRAAIAAADEEGACGFAVRIDNEYLGRIMKSPAASLGHVTRLSSRAGSGQVETIDGAIVRREFRDLHLHFIAINRDTTRAAQHYVDSGGRLAVLRMLVQPGLRFWRWYLLKAGFRDGVRGLMFCLLGAYECFIEFAKAWEYGGRTRRERGKGGETE
jgi:glycosyltransferase involved in cell wall biosynthesis